MSGGRGLLAVLTAVAVVVSGLTVPQLVGPAWAVPPAVDGDVSVPGRDMSTVAEQPSRAEDDTHVTSADAPDPVWPRAGQTVVEVPQAAGRASPGEAAGSSAVAGVSVLADGAAPAALRPGSREPNRQGPGTVAPGEVPTKLGGLAAGGLSQVRVAGQSRAAAQALGAAQVFTVARVDGVAKPGVVDLQVDYSAYAEAFGGNYADRLRLMRLPACALRSPSRPECGSAPVPVEAVNNPTSRTLTARVPCRGICRLGSGWPGRWGSRRRVRRRCSG